MPGHLYNYARRCLWPRTKDSRGHQKRALRLFRGLSGAVTRSMGLLMGLPKVPEEPSEVCEGISWGDEVATSYSLEGGDGGRRHKKPLHVRMLA